MTLLDTRPRSAYPTDPTLGKDCAVDGCGQRSYLKQAFRAPEGYLVTIGVCRDHNGLRDILASAPAERI